MSGSAAIQAALHAQEEARTAQQHLLQLQATLQNQSDSPDEYDTSKKGVSVHAGSTLQPYSSEFLASSLL